MNDIDLLARVGVALYGPRWQTDIARDLRLGDARRVRQWIAGERSIPAGVWPDLVALMDCRGRKLAAARALVHTEKPDAEHT